MKRTTLDAPTAARILFGAQFDEPGFDPATAQFASGADVCDWLADHFGFTTDDYRALMPTPEPEDRCSICGDELQPDDHHTSEHGAGYAHDECIDFEATDAIDVPVERRA